MTNKNPWLVENIEAFSFLCCPECAFKSKEDISFQNHALQNHEQSESFFFSVENCIKIKEENDTVHSDLKEKYENNDNDNDYLTQELDIPNMKTFKIKCNYCDEEFNSELKKEQHIEENHSVYLCSQCSFKSHVLSLLDNHLEFHKQNNDFENSNSEYFECKYCQEMFPSKIVRTRHIKKIHTKEKQKSKLIKRKPLKSEDDLTYDCSYCESKLSTKNSLSVHLSMKHRNERPERIKRAIRTKDKKEMKQYTCNQCSEKFKTKISHKKHALEIHGEKVDCDLCNEKFTNYEDYVNHTQENHHLYFCDKCYNKCENRYRNKKFESRFELEQHRRSEHNEGEPIELKCQECNMVCFNSQGVICHYKRMHNKVPPGYSDYLCDYCAQVFTNKHNLELHVKRQHKTDQPPSLSKDYWRKSQQGRSKKKRNCPHCQKSYSAKDSLTEHILVIHEKSTPFPCDECSQKFGSKRKLKWHKKVVHSKENCDVCGQQIYNFFELKRHKASAHGIIPEDVYLCDDCPLFFKHTANLAKHKKTKHP